MTNFITTSTHPPDLCNDLCNRLTVGSGIVEAASNFLGSFLFVDLRKHTFLINHTVRSLVYVISSFISHACKCTYTFACEVYVKISRAHTWHKSSIWGGTREWWRTRWTQCHPQYKQSQTFPCTAFQQNCRNRCKRVGPFYPYCISLRYDKSLRRGLENI